MPNLTINGQKVLDKLGNQQIFVKLLESPLPDINNPSKDAEWLSLLNQLADPVNQRPVVTLSRSINPTSRYNPKSQRYDKVTPPIARGQSKPNKTHIKKTSVVLAPADGQMKYAECFSVNYPVGILFDTEQCDLKRERYVFDSPVVTDTQWWKPGVTQQDNLPTTCAVSIDDLRKKGRNISSSPRVAAKPNKLLVCPSLGSVVAIMLQSKGEPGDRMNAIYRRELVYKHLGRYVPIIFMGPNQPVKEYTQAEIDKDLQDIKNAGKNTKPISYAFYELSQALIQYNRDNSPNVHINVDPKKVWEAIKNPCKVNTDYLQALFSSGYNFNLCLDANKQVTALDVAIEHKNVEFTTCFLENNSTLVLERQWETLLSFLVRCPESYRISLQCYVSKSKSFPDIKNHSTIFSKILLEALDRDKLHIEIIQFLLGRGIELEGNNDFFGKFFLLSDEKNMIRVVSRALLTANRKVFLAEFNKFINQANEKQQEELMALVAPMISNEEFKAILLQPKFIFNNKIQKIIINQDATGRSIRDIFINEELRASLIKINRLGMNKMLDHFIKTNAFNYTEFSAGFYDDFPQLHQLSQAALAPTIIDKIKTCLDKRAWSVFSRVQGLTFIEAVFAQDNGEANALKLIESIPLPKHYLEYLSEKQALQVLKKAITSAISQIEEKDLEILQEKALAGEGTYKDNDFIYDNKNYTSLQYMIVNNDSDWLEQWLTNHSGRIKDAFICRYRTKNTKESLLSLALKQKKYSLFNTLLKEALTVNPKLILEETAEYVEMLIQNNQIAECVNWLNSGDENLLATIDLNKIPSLFLNDNQEHLKIITQTPLLDPSKFTDKPNKIEALENTLKEIVDKNAKIAPQCLLGLIKTCARIISPMELNSHIVKIAGIKVKDQLNIISDCILNYFKNYHTQETAIARLTCAPQFIPLINQIMTQLPERREEFFLEYVFPHIISGLDDKVVAEVLKTSQKFIKAVEKYSRESADFEKNVETIVRIFACIQREQGQIWSIIKKMPFCNVSLYFWGLLRKANLENSYTDFAQLLTKDEDSRGLFFEHVLDGTVMMKELLDIDVLTIIYNNFPDLSLELFTTWLEKCDLFPWAANPKGTKTLYRFCIENPKIVGWTCQFLEKHFHHIKTDMFPYTPEEMFYNAFEHSAKLCALIFMANPDLNWANLLNKHKSFYQNKNQESIFKKNLKKIAEELAKDPAYQSHRGRFWLESFQTAFEIQQTLSKMTAPTDKRLQVAQSEENPNNTSSHHAKP